MDLTGAVVCVVCGVCGVVRGVRCGVVCVVRGVWCAVCGVCAACVLCRAWRVVCGVCGLRCVWCVVWRCGRIRSCAALRFRAFAFGQTRDTHHAPRNDTGGAVRSHTYCRAAPRATQVHGRSCALRAVLYVCIGMSRYTTHATVLLRARSALLVFAGNRRTTRALLLLVFADAEPSLCTASVRGKLQNRMTALDLPRCCDADFYGVWCVRLSGV